jgi:hypothetical protein
MNESKPGVAGGARLGTWVWTGFVFAILLSALGGAWLALALATANLGNLGQFARDYAKSPGPAAFAALIAAVIAFIGISKQLVVARAALKHQQDSAQEASWWEAFQWASGRAIPEGKDDIRLPDSVTVDTLRRLVDDATTEVQRTACRGMVDHLSSRLASETESKLQDPDSADVRSANEAYLAFARYVSATEGTAASSPHASALVYEDAVKRALAETNNPEVRVYRNPDERVGADAIIQVGSEKALLWIKWGTDTKQIRFRVRKDLERLRKVVDASPFLVVTPVSLGFDQLEQNRLGFASAQWRGPEDNENLITGLTEALALGMQS